MTFKVGDIVRVRGGIGPRMICARYVDQPGLFGDVGWQCRWFIQSAERRSVFDEALLELAPDEEPKPARKPAPQTARLKVVRSG